jgi:hypothetical protein
LTGEDQPRNSTDHASLSTERNVVEYPAVQHTSATMALKTAYKNLQLEPNDHSRMAAFSAFCWRHILEHETPRWIAEVRDGTVRLQHRIWAPGSEQSCSIFHEAINRMVYGFILAYAELLWPANNGSREHLASTDRPGWHVKAIYATPTNLTITRKKEAEMSECNVTTNSKTSTVESMIGCRVRAYLTQLLLSAEAVPDYQPMSVLRVFQTFLHMGSTPARADKKRNYTSMNDYADNENHALVNSGPEPSPTRKRRHVSGLDTTASHTFQGRRNGYVRLRFTFRGARRLQQMLSCPPRPTSASSESSEATGQPENSIGDHSGNESLRSQDNTSAIAKCRCWVWSCDEEFKTMADILEHVNNQHRYV